VADFNAKGPNSEPSSGNGSSGVQSFETVTTAAIPKMADLSGRKLGPYTVDRVMHEGSATRLFEGHRDDPQESVAIKLLHESLTEHIDGVQRYYQDAEKASGIDHPHIVKVIQHEAGASGVSYLVMELLTGEDLETLSLRMGRLANQRAVGLIVQVCEALAAAHDIGVLHGDLKPKHIFLCSGESKEDHIKVLDFGIVHLLDEVESRLQGSLGPPSPYRAPEHTLGSPVKDPCCDVYSLGVIIYRTLTGKLPFGEPDASGSANISPSPICNASGEVMPELNDVVMRCLAPLPGERYQTVAALAEDLLDTLQMSQAPVELASEPTRLFSQQDMVEGKSPVVITDEVTIAPERTRPRAHKRWPTIVIAMLATIILALGVIWFLDRRSEGLLAQLAGAPATSGDTPAIPATQPHLDSGPPLPPDSAANPDSALTDAVAADGKDGSLETEAGEGARVDSLTPAISRARPKKAKNKTRRRPRRSRRPAPEQSTKGGKAFPDEDLAHPPAKSSSDDAPKKAKKKKRRKKRPRKIEANQVKDPFAD